MEISLPHTAMWAQVGRFVDESAKLDDASAHHRGIREVAVRIEA